MTQIWTKNHTDYTIRTRVRVIENFAQIILYGRRSIGLHAIYKLFIFQEKVLPTIIFFTK